MTLPEHPSESELVDGYLRHLSHLAQLRVPTSRNDLAETRELVHVALETDDYFWAWERLEDLISSDPAAAWRVLLQIINNCLEGTLYIVGAGPLEDFFVGHAQKFQNEISEELRANPRFRSAFRNAYLYDVPEHIWRKFHAVLAELGVPAAELPDWSR